MRIGVVISLFNRPVTEKLERGALDYLREHGVTDHRLKVVHVPGAVEIPLAAKALLLAGYDGVVAVGAVIRGETSHFDYVCLAAERGCSQLQLEFMKPVGFGVITTENAEQAFARAGGAKGNKGAEAAETVLTMLKVLKEIK